MRRYQWFTPQGDQILEYSQDHPMGLETFKLVDIERVEQTEIDLVDVKWAQIDVIISIPTTRVIPNSQEIVHATTQVPLKDVELIMSRFLGNDPNEAAEMIVTDLHEWFREQQEEAVEDAVTALKGGVDLAGTDLVLLDLMED